MRLFNKVAIVGTGLIGGSLGLAIRRKGLAKEVVGISRHKKNVALAVKIGAIDRGSRSLSIIKGADLVILAMPVGAIIRLAPKISGVIGPGSIITDVGSTKVQIVSRLTAFFPGFVGSHPLAGSEKRGVANAKPGLFKDSICLVTPAAKTRKDALRKIKTLWESVGAKVVYLDPKTHDAALSLISHLPHVAAFSLMNSMPDAFLKFAPPSLRDATRIAASEGELWGDILYSNRNNILKAIGIFQKELSRIRSAIKNKDAKSLRAILNSAKSKREKIK